MGGFLNIVGGVAGVGGMVVHLVGSVAGEVLREAETHAPAAGRLLRGSARLAAAPVRFGSRVVTESAARPVVTIFRAVDSASKRLDRALRPSASFTKILPPLIGAAMLYRIVSRSQADQT